MSIERFPWFAHIFDLTIFLTDPTRQLKIPPLSPIPRLALGFIRHTVTTFEMLVVKGRVRMNVCWEIGE